MNLQEVIEVLKDAKYIGSDEYASDYDRRMKEAIDTVVETLEKPLPCERCKKLEYMIENGLGWKDIENDISPMHEL